LTRDPYLAEDLVQEVLARAYPRWNSIFRRDDPDVYLRRMLVNENISRWRRRSSREVIGRLPDQVADLADAGADLAERDAMWQLLADLPTRQRVTVVLRYYEDLDDNTIAAILDCSPVTVRTHAMRALSTLRLRLDGVTRAAGTMRSR
jgi:RNA polymerase sigma-70 factor (sigma-E family)